jgi:hypothetical protein
VSSPVQHSVLIISPLSEVANFAAPLADTLGCPVEVADTHRAGLAARRRRDYSVVVVDHCMAEANSDNAELLWRNAGMALPMHINFAISGAERLTREVQAAIGRWEQHQVVAMRAAASMLEGELKSTITGLLLQSQLALAEAELTPKLAGKLELVAELAVSLRQRLERAQV